MKAAPKLAGWILAAAGLPAVALAAPCYTVIDRNDTTVYRATDPPFALAGPEYEAGMRRLRAAGQQLFWFEPPGVCFEERPVVAGAPEVVGADAGSLLQARDALPRGGGGGITGTSAAPASTTQGPTTTVRGVSVGRGRY